MSLDLLETCACGVHAEYDNNFTGTRVIVSNGTFCLDCEKFGCNACAEKGAAADGNYDPALCSACNGTWVAAGFGAA